MTVMHSCVVAASASHCCSWGYCGLYGRFRRIGGGDDAHRSGNVHSLRNRRGRRVVSRDCETVDMSTGLKRCTKCGQELPATTEYFSRTNRTRSGLYSWCKRCRRSYREANKNRISEWGREYRKANKEQIRAYYEANRDRLSEYDRMYYKANKDRISERRRMYRQTEHGRQVRCAIQHHRRALKAGNGGSYTTSELEAVKKAAGGRCWLCGKKLKGKYHVDHFIPLSKGGTNDAGNLRIVCPKCNFSKHDKLPWEHNGRLI